MSATRWTLCVLTLLATAGCAVDDRCPGDDIEYDSTYAVCAPVAAEPAGDGDGDGDATGSGGAQADAGGMDDEGEPFEFGAACTEDADCGPGVCVNMPLPVGCTMPDCRPGEANEGICPADFMCLGDDSGSACIKF